MKHPIRRYCEDRMISQAEFAKQIKRSPQLVSDLIAGRTKCGRETALAIVRVTGGEITLAELFTFENAA